MTILTSADFDGKWCSLEHLAMKFTLTPIQSAACFHSFPLRLDFAYFAASSAITKLQNTRPLWSASLTCVRRLWRLRPNTIDAILIQWHVNWVAGYSEVAPYYTQLRQSTVKVPECLWEKFWRTLAAMCAKKWTSWVWFSSGLVLQKCFWLLVLTIGLDSWLMTLCLLLLLKTQGEWKSASATNLSRFRRYFNLSPEWAPTYIFGLECLLGITAA